MAVTDTDFVIEGSGEKTIAKPQIVRISTGETPDVHTAVFSGRSSWADVEALQSTPYYSNLMLVTKDERRFRGVLIGVSAEQITLTVDGKEMRFAKEFLARVLLTGKKPAYERNELHWNPLSLSKKIIAPMQPVPLYEVTLQEDNSSLGCSVAYRRRPQ